MINTHLSRQSSLVATVLLLLLVIIGASGGADGYNNGFGERSRRGWNTWCSDVQCGVDWCAEWNIKQMALAMISNGLQSAGYNTIQLDDCWSAAQRSPSGALQWNATRFPSGMPALQQWLRDRGFVFGLYVSLGDMTCVGGRPGSYGHYQQDANTIASWGVRRVKIDYCGGHLNRTAAGTYLQHKEFSDAFNRTGVPIEIFLCRGYGPNSPPHMPSWTQTLAQGARASGDHHDNLQSSLTVIASMAVAASEAAGRFAGYRVAGAGGKLDNSYFWLSVDLLYTGGQGCPPEFNVSAHCPGQSDDNYRMFFSVAAMSSSDLMISTDVRYMTPIMVEVLLNEEVLSIQRDRSVMGTQLTNSAPGCTSPTNCQIWTRDLADGSVAILFVNSNVLATQSFAVSLNVIFPQASSGSIARPRDLWMHTDEDEIKVDGGTLAVYNLGPGACKFYRVSTRPPW